MRSAELNYLIFVRAETCTELVAPSTELRSGAVVLVRGKSWRCGKTKTIQKLHSVKYVTFVWDRKYIMRYEIKIFSTRD